VFTTPTSWDGLHLVLEQLIRTQLRIGLDDRDVLCELGEEESFFEPAVATSDDRELFGAAIERAVARRAEVDTRTNEVRLSLGVSPAVRGAVATSTAGALTWSPSRARLEASALTGDRRGTTLRVSRRRSLGLERHA